MLDKIGWRKLAEYFPKEMNERQKREGKNYKFSFIWNIFERKNFMINVTK
jgi:hypothetical protein